MNDYKVRTIIVEDHDVMRSFLKDYIGKVDHCQIVAEARNGDEAVDIIKKIAVDFVVLDLVLPRLSGLAVLEEVKKRTQAKVLVVTMTDKKDTLQQALDAGADGICHKSKAIDILSKAVLEALGGKKPVYVDGG